VLERGEERREASPCRSTRRRWCRAHLLRHDENRVRVSSQQTRDAEHCVENLLVDAELATREHDHELLEEPDRRPRWAREVVRMPVTTSNAPVFFTSAEEHAVAAGRVGVPTNGLVPEIAGEQDGLQDWDRHSPEEPKVDLGRGHNRRRRSADPSLRQLLDNRLAGQFVLQPPRPVW
jgi:hypothetical protein